VAYFRFSAEETALKVMGESIISRSRQKRLVTQKNVSLIVTMKERYVTARSRELYRMLANDVNLPRRNSLL
jgi:hypothetical protein